MKELENLEQRRQLKRESAAPGEIASMIQSAARRLADSRNSSLAWESRFDLAYNAAHSLALAALRWCGYRSENRYLVFQCLSHTLGYDAAGWRLFDLAHRRRNIAEYEGEWKIDEKFLDELVRAAGSLLHAVEELTQGLVIGRSKEQGRDVDL